MDSNIQNEKPIGTEKQQDLTDQEKNLLQFLNEQNDRISK